MNPRQKQDARRGRDSYGVDVDGDVLDPGESALHVVVHPLGDGVGLAQGQVPVYGDLQLPYIGETELAGDLGFLFAAYSPEDNAMVTATCLDNGEWSHRSIPIPSPAQSTVYDRPRMDGTSSAGSSAKYARADHVHPKDTSKLDLDQGTANAGKFLVVGSDGNIAPVAMAAWEGGSY